MTIGVDLQFFKLLLNGGKNCRIITYSESCINAVASGMVTKLGLKTVHNPQPYTVSWVNFASIDVMERCIVSILFATYSNKIWCDVVIIRRGLYNFRMNLVI